MFRKKVLIDRNALDELKVFPLKVQIEFEAYFAILKQEGWLEFPNSKKITRNLYEIRVRFQGEYRGFYAYFGKEYIIVLLFFQKKTQKTPGRNIKTAEWRLKRYE